MTRNKKAPSAAVHEGSGAGTVRIIGGQWRGRDMGVWHSVLLPVSIGPVRPGKLPVSIAA